MSVIFEGVDGVGKTTRAIKLMHDKPMFRYIHNWAKPIKEVDILSEITKEMILLNSPIQVILDRSYIISEFVYATVLGRDTCVTIEHVKELIHIINEHHHVVNLLCYTDHHALKCKPEDVNLPHNILNSFYMDLFLNILDVDSLITDVINISRKGEKDE